MSMADILSDCTFALSVFPVSLQECSPMMTTQSCSGSTPPLWRMKRSTHSLESSWDLPFITTASWTFIFLWLSTGSWWERKGRSWTYQTHIQYSSYNLARFKAQVDFCFCFLRYLLTFFPQNQIFSCDRVTETLCLCCRFYTKAWKSCWSTRAMWKKTWCSLFRYRTQIYLEIQYCMIWRSREIRLLLPRQTDRSDIYVCRPQSEVYEQTLSVTVQESTFAPFQSWNLVRRNCTYKLKIQTMLLFLSLYICCQESSI